MWLANKGSIHIPDRKAGRRVWTDNTDHFASTPVITLNYKFNNILMRCLTLDFLAAKWYQFKLLIRSVEHFSMGRVPSQRYFIENVFLKRNYTKYKDENDYASQFLLLEWSCRAKRSSAFI